MKTILITIAICCSLLTAQDAVQVAVLPLDPSGISIEQAEFMSDRLRMEIFQTGQFQVVERAKMEEILNEQQFQQQGCTSLECAVEIGRLLNVRKILAGSIGQIDELYSINVRLIDVQSGVIEETATRDFEGKKSEFLTQVIPEIARDLAGVQTEEKAIKKFALFLKLGWAFLQYTDDWEESIRSFNESSVYRIDEKPSAHNHITFEGRYLLSPDWALKAGFGIENIISPYEIVIEELNVPNTTLKYVDVRFERSYQLFNPYIGINYTFWRPSESYNWYAGLDIGTTILDSRIEQGYTILDNRIETDDHYSYNGFTIKLLLGITYDVSEVFMLAAEVVAQAVSKYDTSGETRAPDFPQNLDPILFPEEINGSGLKINLTAGYRF